MPLWSVHTVAILITLDPTTKELPVLDVQPGTHAKINSVSNIIQVLSISLCIYLSIYLSLFLFIFPTTYIHLSIICKFIHDCTIYLFFFTEILSEIKLVLSTNVIHGSIYYYLIKPRFYE